MIFSHKHRVGFIHIPKSAGTSVRAALLSIGPDDFYEAATDHMHVFGRLIRDWVLGRTGFYRVRWFAIARHPVETLWSAWSHSRRVAESSNRRGFSTAYCDYLDRFLKYGGFEEYVETEWLNEVYAGGLWRTYCCEEDGRPLPVRVLRYDSLVDDWVRLCNDCNLPQIELPRLNVGNSGFRRDLISAEIYDEVLRYWRDDVRRFGWV